MAILKYPGLLTKINYENRSFTLEAPKYIKLSTNARYVANSLAVEGSCLYYAPSPYMDAMEVLEFDSKYSLEAFLYQCKYRKPIPVSRSMSGFVFCIVIVDYPDSPSKIIEYVNEMSTKKYKTTSNNQMNFPFSLIGIDADTDMSLSSDDAFIMTVSNDYKFSSIPKDIELPHKSIKLAGTILNPKALAVLFKALDQYYKGIVTSTAVPAQEKVTWKSIYNPIGAYIKTIEDKSLKSTVQLKKLYSFIHATLESPDPDSLSLLGAGPESENVLFSKSIKKFLTTRLKTLAGMIDRIKDEQRQKDIYDDLNVLLIAVMFCYIMHSVYARFVEEVQKVTPYVHLYKTLNQFFLDLLDKSTTVESIPNDAKKLNRVLGLIDLATKKFRADITDYIKDIDYEEVQ